MNALVRERPIALFLNTISMHGPIHDVVPTERASQRPRGFGDVDGARQLVVCYTCRCLARRNKRHP